MADKPKKKILHIDPYLAPFEKDIDTRVNLFKEKKKQLVGARGKLTDFANGHNFFGFNRTDDGWVYREWAPAAEEMYLTGDFNGWNIYGCPMQKKENGVFEVNLNGKDALKPGQKLQAVVISSGSMRRRIPLYATRVVQDSETGLWCAELEDTFDSFLWTDADFAPDKTPIIYECHIGMAQENGKVGTYREFIDNILPRIKKAGYNTIQLMAIMEHPYYASFGYQVSNFFAASSRYGKSSELKELINKAHGMNIAVLLDVVHSHAIKNTNEGISDFDGTVYQFFHKGERGNHEAWGTKLFNYGKNEVLHFLLSNLKYWMEIFHFDGFRFDGVTSMLYHDHGIGKAFTNYGMYFSDNTDTEAITYLQLANELIHEINPVAVTVAEDMSGMPGMCLPISCGGIGFDYRLSMGVPDMWIKTVKESADEEWDMWRLWYELTTHRPKEKNIGYAESHDQALVGDKTLMFRLCDAEMYTHMSKGMPSIVIDRGMALHKMIRLITASVGGEGYLNFMGNEFGHPEWIDFPREGNGWSYHYCRRQWSLADNEMLRYGELGNFDRAMIFMLKQEKIFEKETVSRWIDQNNKIIIYSKGDVIFAFNFNPVSSFEKYFVPVGKGGKYSVILSTDDGEFGGFGRVSREYEYKAVSKSGKEKGFYCYLPSRSALVFKKQTDIGKAVDKT